MTASSRFHDLRIARISPEAAGSVAIAFTVPDDLLARVTPFLKKCGYDLTDRTPAWLNAVLALQLERAKTLKQVAEHSSKIVEALNASARIPLSLVFKPVLKTPDEIRQLCLDANHAPQCAGLLCSLYS